MIRLLILDNKSENSKFYLQLNDIAWREKKIAG